VIPELEETVRARRGFAVIATANTRDRGVNDMSAALKRRFNFVTIPVIGDLEREVEIVARRSRETLVDLGLAAAGEVPRDLIRLLATVFAELRGGQTLDGQTRITPPAAVLSTAELISTVASGALLASFFGTGRPTVADAFSGFLGTVTKEGSGDEALLREYLDTVVRPRREGAWPAFYAAGRDQLG
jgi:hypothetical protein